MRKFLRKLIRILLNRNTLFVVLLLIQAAMLVLTILFLSQHYLPVYAVLIALDVVLVIYITNTSENPSYKIPWLVAMLILPLFAGFAYLLVKTDAGHKTIKQECADKMRETKKDLTQDPAIRKAIEDAYPDQGGLARYIADYGGYPAYRNYVSEFYPVGEAMFEAMKREIKAAKRYIFLEYFIINNGVMWDEILTLLKEKAAQGIDVRLMYDGFGTQFMMPHEYFQKLSEFGIQCRVFNSFKPFLSSAQNNRDHRKILAIDGHTAFTGGINLADEYINRKLRFGHWKDGGILCKGDAAWSFTVMFLQLWDLDTKTTDLNPYRPTELIHGTTDGFIQPYSDSPTDDENVGKNVYLDIINHAKRYCYVMTPYLILDHELITAMGLAAKRGVDMRIMTPHIPDKWYAYETAWSYYRELLEQHVRIFEYEPGFVHAKNMTSDDVVSVVGTINMDYRSLYLHFECAAVLYGSSTVRQVRHDFDETLHHCIEITLGDCEKRSIPKRMAGWVLRMFAPLL